MSDRDGTFDLYRTATAGGPIRRVTDPAFADTWPNWSPVGNDIAFVRSEGGNRDLYTVHQNGRNLARLTETPERDEVAPAWSPDGERLLFLGCIQGACDLFVRSIDGSGNETKLTHGGAGAADWQPLRHGS